MLTWAVCWIKYCIVKLLHRIKIMLNFISVPPFISVFLLVSGLVNYENFSDSSELFLVNCGGCASGGQGHKLDSGN